MKVDLGGRLQFPKVIQTTLRPDVVLWSEEAKKIILIKLTVPWEEQSDQAFERKSARWMIAGEKGARHDCSQLRSAAKDSLPSQCGECSQP